MKNSRQLLRFGVVGGINTVLDFGLLFAFTSIGVPVGIANVMSTGIAFIFSFFANKKYTFKSTDTNIVREMILFVIVTLFGLWVLQTHIISAILPLMSSILHNHEIALLASKLLATVVSLTWNYFLYSRIVFAKR